MVGARTLPDRPEGLRGRQPFMPSVAGRSIRAMADPATPAGSIKALACNIEAIDSLPSQAHRQDAGVTDATSTDSVAATSRPRQRGARTGRGGVAGPFMPE
jgi:hypothetical protein